MPIVFTASSAVPVKNGAKEGCWENFRNGPSGNEQLMKSKKIVTKTKNRKNCKHKRRGRVDRGREGGK